MKLVTIYHMEIQQFGIFAAQLVVFIGNNLPYL
jgi:hypothetical protein